MSVAPETTYMYAVRAIDAAGNLGDASASVTVTTPAAPVPAPARRTGREEAEAPACRPTSAWHSRRAPPSRSAARRRMRS